MSFYTEACEKVDAFDVYALVDDYLGGQHGIESTGNQ